MIIILVYLSFSIERLYFHLHIVLCGNSHAQPADMHDRLSATHNPQICDAPAAVAEGDRLCFRCGLPTYGRTPTAVAKHIRMSRIVRRLRGRVGATGVGPYVDRRRLPAGCSRSRARLHKNPAAPGRAFERAQRSAPACTSFLRPAISQNYEIFSRNENNVLTLHLTSKPTDFRHTKRNTTGYGGRCP